MSRRWKNLEISVGEVQENSTVRVVFEGTEELPEIMELKAGCLSCTNYKFDEETKRLHVSVVLGLVPVHLRMARKDQPFNKVVKVKYYDGTMDVLSISGSKTMR